MQHDYVTTLVLTQHPSWGLDPDLKLKSPVTYFTSIVTLFVSKSLVKLLTTAVQFKAVGYSLFVVAPIVCVGFVLGPCFVLQYFVSLLVLQSSCWGRIVWPKSNSFNILGRGLLGECYIRSIKGLGLLILEKK